MFTYIKLRITDVCAIIFASMIIMGLFAPADVFAYGSDEVSPFVNKRLAVFTEGKELAETCGAARVSYFEPAGEYILDFEDESATGAAYEILNRRYGRDNVIPDIPIKPQGETFDATPALSGSWGVDTMMLDTARDRANADKELKDTVTVAVLDTGIYAEHELFGSRLDKDARSFIGKKDDISDATGHGTHVAGIIADGTSRQVKILPIKVLSAEGKGGFVEVINGIYYAIEQGADVINLSLAINLNDYGNYWSDPALAKEEAALKKAEDGGCLCVAAAGNDSKNLDTLRVYPAISEHTITVSSIKADLSRASSSNYGASIDLAAPGDLIKSASISGKDEYCVKSGTSMAAPHISAACAMLRLYNRDASVAELKDLLFKSAIDIGAPGKDKKFGNGYVLFKDGIIPVIPKETENKPEASDEPEQKDKETKKEDPKKEDTGKEKKKPAVIKPKGTSFTKLVKKKTTLKVAWKKQMAMTAKKRITGYQIQYSTKKNFLKNRKSVVFKGYKKTSATLKKLSRGRRYYLRIRTFLKAGSKTYYSGWSPKKTVKL